MYEILLYGIKICTKSGPSLIPAHPAYLIAAAGSCIDAHGHIRTAGTDQERSCDLRERGVPLHCIAQYKEINRKEHITSTCQFQHEGLRLWAVSYSTSAYVYTPIPWTTAASNGSASAGANGSGVCGSKAWQGIGGIFLSQLQGSN